MRSIALPLLLLVLTVMVHHTTKATSEDETVKVLRDYYNITRYTYFTTNRVLTKYPPGFCGGSPIDDCDWAKYGEAVVLLGGITLIIALVCLAFAILFWMGRSFFFGGCSPTHGLLCPGPKYDPEIGEGYTSCQVWALRIVVILFAVASVPLFITAMTGNARTTEGVNNLGNIVLDKANSTLTSIQNITLELNTTQFTRLDQYTDNRIYVINELNKITDQGLKIQHDAETINNYTRKFNSWRRDIILAGLITGLVICVAVALSGILSIPIICLIAALTLVIVLPFTWIVFSVHYPINSLLSDTCTTFNSSGTGISNETNPIAYQLYKGCQNESNTISVFQNLEELGLNLINSSYNEACGDGVDRACNMPPFPLYPNNDYNQAPVSTKVYDCTGIPPCGNGTTQLYLAAPIYDFQLGCYAAGVANCPMNVPNWDGNCPSGSQLISCNVRHLSNVSECAAGCVNPVLKNVSQVAEDGLTALEAFQEIWDHQITPLIKCSNLWPFVQDVQEVICVDEVNALVLLISPTGLFAILMIGVGITAVLGTKRFNSKARAQKSMGQEMA
ncbi:hypothetical protein SAMD00019534_016690 [Acytostelium subglobosum LB1]|uniref:hypothetical protein n=1 Tax=Acytostelium subglobosum LB1 TaxID=1410327 RepID=UPI000644F651|nr:hypothetical protein SAMD00019534_016690 [Acytostelium subglobosum LB1]GAM18494.1 hypothetical protein SAMD00019534_016690 [Acytostelium subglobosum LB1]|eukprot:XP_012757714.1 hypothetical protein SAMD00019534_016690 [Acytostelium subglobosum LB1]